MSKNKIVHRHRIGICDYNVPITCCGSAKVIHVGLKHGEADSVQLWVEQAEPALELTERRFRVFGTGQPIPEGYHHKGTVVAGPFVWHLYEFSTYQRA